MQINSVPSLSSSSLRIDQEQKVSLQKESSQSRLGSAGQGGTESDDSIDTSRVTKLQVTDAKVRSHEAAHLAAGAGVVTGGADFSYTRGPDGKMYAVAGEVPIDSGEASTPEATIQKARKIAAAAMAPADPSPQDYRVATSAIMMEQRARMEMVREQMEQIDGARTYGGLDEQEEMSGLDLRSAGSSTEITES